MTFASDSNASASPDPNPAFIEAAARAKAEAAAEIENVKKKAKEDAIKDIYENWESGFFPPKPLGDVQAYDEHMMPCEDAQKFVSQGALQLGCPPDYIAVSVLMVIGAVAGRRMVVRAGKYSDRTTYMNNFGLIIGPPTAVKSPAMEYSMRPLRRISAALIEKHDSVLANFASQMSVWEVQEKIATKEIATALNANDLLKATNIRITLDQQKPKIPHETILEVNALTMQRLTQAASTNPKGFLLWRDELSGFFIELENDMNGGMREILLTAYDGNSPHRYETKGAGREISYPLISIFGSAQFAKISKHILASKNGTERDDGFIQRFSLMIYPDPISNTAHVDVSTPPGNDVWLEHLLERIVNLPDVVDPQTGFPKPLLPSIVMPFEEKAYLYYQNNIQKLREETWAKDYPPYLQNHFKKYEKTVIGLAGILSLIEKPTAYEVSEKGIRLAFRWIRYLKTHALRIFNATADKALEAFSLLTFFGKNPDHLGWTKDGFTAQALMKKDFFKPMLTVFQSLISLEKALAILVEWDWIREIVSKTTMQKSGGIRVNHKFFLHPTILDGTILKDLP